MIDKQLWIFQHIRLALSVWFGILGVDRFYNRQIALGVIKAITGGAAGIWWLVDMCYYAYQAGKEDLPLDWPRPYVLLAIGAMVGYFGLDRFYKQEILWGVLKLISFGGLGVWWLVDVTIYAYRAAELHPGATAV